MKSRFRIDVKFWKEVLFKAWLYNWGPEEILEYCIEEGKLKEFKVVWRILERVKQGIEVGRPEKFLSQKELETLSQHPFLWGLLEILF